MTIKDGDEGSPSTAPVSTGEFNELKSSIDTRFDELKDIILSMQNKTTTSVPPLPANTITTIPGFVAASNDPKGLKDAGTEKKPVEVEGGPEDFNDDDSVHTTNPKHSKANGAGMYSAIPDPSSYTGAPLVAPHYANVGNPPMLDPSSFANWQFLMRSNLRAISNE